MQSINKVIPNFITRPYVAKNTIRILNINQVSFYWSNGVQPVDIYMSTNKHTGNPCIVFVFDREEQLDVYDRWVKMKNDNNE